MRRPLTSVSAAAAVLLLAACGSNGDKPAVTGAEQTPAPSADPGLQHIHGLGVSGDTLYIATHTGLWVAPGGKSKAVRYSQSRQDIMGFSVLSGGRFIGSGHPAPEQNLPPNLGLIESGDGGRTWKSVSLNGEADFHVLESAGSQVYGFDGTQGRLMVSSNGGRTWAQRKPPAPMFSLAIDPRDHDRIVTATESGLYASRNAGRSWQALRSNLAGLLAWPAPDRLYLIDGAGQVALSADGGREWSTAGSLGALPVAFMADGRDLYAALGDATVKRSADGGRTWTLRATP